VWVFKHIGNEVLIDRRGNLVTDLTFVEKLFVTSKRSLGDHSILMYKNSLKACLLKNTTSNSIPSKSVLKDLLVIAQSVDQWEQKESENAPLLPVN